MTNTPGIPTALEHPETGQAAELWDRLSDRMFELGVYL